MPGLIEEPVLSKKEIKKRKKEEARKRKQEKKKEKQTQFESIDLGERAGEEFVYVPLNKKKRRDFLDTVAIADVKSILYGYPNQPIRLANGYSGYVQIFEVFGQDIQAMSNEEQAAVKVGFTLFLSGTTFDMMLQTTKLPTDVSSQSNEFLRLLDEVKQEQNAPELIINDGDDLDTIANKERLIYQLRQREDILKTKYLVQQVVAINQQNIEFFIWVFGDTLAEIDSNTRTTLTIASSHGFAPKVVSVEKKEELLTQYYNFNDSLNGSPNQY
ncbi:hypothetical protein BSR19_11500 (plasmid) [Streptococcus salivarius]|uniref:Uncharacterized protein n=1 Tax=Streptococcus salivarius TaxID=1304 RepID=A0AB37DDN6_STRSL|nr:hypothetical protein [Streptococcus salivarius]QGU81743.1 hypothetical protein BSR19_11500 [Streptococcus salivarius]